ncbi:hypothetical protein BDV18DRAFT_26775 [Aspergillus unguis]
MLENNEITYFSFLDSPMVSLKATESGRPFHIHQALLASKSKTIAAAFERGFDEKQKGVYTFQDTSEATLSRFIQWAYTGDYPLIVKRVSGKRMKRLMKGEFVPIIEKSEEKEGNENIERIPDDPQPCLEPYPESDLTPEDINHPLLSHIRLYLFASIYMVLPLQDLCFDKVTATLGDMNCPTTLDTQLAVIAALRVAFTKLLSSDRLLDWLAQYASYSLAQLRVQRDFHDLLQEAPILASRMVLTVTAAQSPPWKSTPPKYEFQHYTGYYQYDD